MMLKKQQISAISLSDQKKVSYPIVSFENDKSSKKIEKLFLQYRPEGYHKIIQK